ncbi:magnesium transporter CorA family protein [Flocculibacter collagenilyticus]|uniref:magnesium transporter CorA family protein n=1 Tax=Flocculibacter collagenilyticus TaxID=2744479 RepID=UPI0018F6E565|nr:magnesium transporter CorA family protein [Flocculibacter collagenilyticus]
MISFRYKDNNEELETTDEGILSSWKQNADSRIWINISYRPEQECDVKAWLVEFGCHEMAVQDALRYRHPPKIEFFDNHLFMIFRDIEKVNSTLNFNHQQIAFFASDRYLITVHVASLDTASVYPSKQKTTSLIETPLNLACVIMHNCANCYLKQLLQFETQLGDLEDGLFDNGNDQMLAEITNYRSSLIKLIRIFNYHKEISQQLKQYSESNDTLDFASALHTINDLHDRFERLHSLSNMYHDICSDLIDGYISITSHKLNNTMRVLTVITAIFVPLSFLAGLYGMNFENIPELKYQYGYPVLLFVMLFIAIALITIFKKRKWF